MPYRELPMIDVKEVLRRWSARQGLRRIARETGADRTTIARYINAASTLGLEPGCELTDEVVHNVAQCVQARPLATPSDEWTAIARHRALIERWLAGHGDARPLKLTKLRLRPGALRRLPREPESREEDGRRARDPSAI